MPTTWDLLYVFVLATRSVAILVVLPIAMFSSLAFFCLSLSSSLVLSGPTAAAFAAFGTVIGLLIGSGESAQLSGILPALVALIATYITYLGEKDNDPAKRASYAFSLLGFFLGTAFGFFYGTASAAALKREVAAYSFKAFGLA